MPLVLSFLGMSNCEETFNQTLNSPEGFCVPSDQRTAS